MSLLGEIVTEAVAEAAITEPLDRAMQKWRWLRWVCYGLMALLVGVLIGTFAADYIK